MSGQRVVVVGASGQGAVVADILERAGEVVVGFVDARKPAGTPWAGLSVLGVEADLPRLAGEHRLDGVALGIGDNFVRRRVAEVVDEVWRGDGGGDRAGGSGSALPFVATVHPSAVVGRGARLGVGVRLMAGAVVGAGAVVEDHATIDTNASLDHDCVLGAFASLAPGVAVGGGTRIGACTAVGIGAAVGHGRTIGEHTVVGAGSVVLRDLPDHVVAYGVPARVARARSEGEPYL